MKPPSHMGALLVTACGCSARIRIPFPPSPERLVQLAPPMSFKSFERSEPPSRPERYIRRFRLHAVDHGQDGELVAHYREELEPR